MDTVADKAACTKVDTLSCSHKNGEDAMPFQPAPGCVRVSMEYSSGLQVIVNTFHFEYLGTLDVTALESICNVFETWEGTHNKDKRWNGSFWNRVTAIDLSTASGPSFELTPGAPVAGTQAAEPVANNVAVCTTLRTAKRGRSYRGRVYWGMLTTLTVTGDGVNGTEAAEYDSNLDSLQTAAQGENFRYSVLTRYSGGALRPIGEPNAVTGHSTATVVRSQRRRLPD